MDVSGSATYPLTGYSLFPLYDYWNKEAQGKQGALRREILRKMSFQNNGIQFRFFSMKEPCTGSASIGALAARLANTFTHHLALEFNKTRQKEKGAVWWYPQLGAMLPLSFSPEVILGVVLLHPLRRLLVEVYLLETMDKAVSTEPDLDQKREEGHLGVTHECRDTITLTGRGCAIPS